MGKLFGSLYLYIIVSVLLLSGVVEKFWPHKEGEQALMLHPEFTHSIALLLTYPDGLQQVQQHYPSAIFQINEIAFLPEQQAQLARGEAVLLFNQQQQASWYFQLPQQQLLQLGPIDIVTPNFDSSWPYLVMLLLIGLPIGLWSLWLLRDFNKLRYACDNMVAPESAEFASGYSSALLPITDVLRALQSRIKQLLSSQKELTSAVSHEFRTPLARLKFAIAMLEEYPLNEEQYNYIDGMTRDISELEALVTEMLNFAKMDRETPALNLIEVNLTELAGQTMEKLQLNHGLSLQLMQTESVFYRCDAHFMTRVLQNLIGNAIKYAQSCVQVEINQQSDHIKLIVSDDGSGINPQDWEQVFKPFIRLDKSRDKQKGGFGLGLAIVSKIVDWHHGRLYLQQGSLKGASFVIELPLNSQ